jgi:prepilin-type N-terminal cleavage/methylation domain-containing protein
MNSPHYLSAKTSRAFTFIELLIVLALFVIVATMILLPALQPQSRTRAPRINCVNNLKQVGLAFKLWAADHQEKFPMQVSVTNGGTMELVDSDKTFMHFAAISNELSTPKVLVCPADSTRKPAADFSADLDNAKISYFVGVDANSTLLSQMFLSGDFNITNGHRAVRSMLELTTNDIVEWSHALHDRQGNVGLADGSVQQFTITKLREALTFTGLETNRLAMP